MTDVQPRSLNPATEIAALPVVNPNTLEVIAYAYIGRDGSIGGLDTVEARQYFMAALPQERTFTTRDASGTETHTRTTHLSQIMAALPDATSQRAFIGNVSSMTEEGAAAGAAREVYSGSATIGGQTVAITVNADNNITGITPAMISAGQIDNGVIAQLIRTADTDAKKEALRDALVNLDENLAGTYDIAEGIVDRETRAAAVPVPPAPVPLASDSVLNDTPLVTGGLGVGVDVTVADATPAPAPVTTPVPATVTAAPVPVATQGWSYGIATDYKNGAEGRAADQQIGNDEFERTSIQSLLADRFGIQVEGTPPTVEALNAALQGTRMQELVAAYNQGKPADQQLNIADLDLARVQTLTGAERDAANDKFVSTLVSAADSSIAGGRASSVDGVPLSALDSDTIRAMQDFMNDQGFRDANGQPLAVDGIVGPKTAYAFDALEAAAGITPATGAISPALLEFVTHREALALTPEEERSMAIAAENGNLTEAEAGRITAIDHAIDEMAARGVNVDGIREQFADVRAAMADHNNMHDGKTLDAELGELVASAGPNAAAIRDAAGMSR